ncbi:uncharacterized protein YjbI with pentapeptide repeats [Constrictibacter sp. MBR-5]|uniref:pentapeptide repeat-containing protein n=1 Tax=Constrictibacter sp. MBR-5 TaxID=3156467 RepID=UPI00339976C7
MIKIKEGLSEMAVGRGELAGLLGAQGVGLRSRQCRCIDTEGRVDEGSADLVGGPSGCGGLVDGLELRFVRLKLQGDERRKCHMRYRALTTSLFAIATAAASASLASSSACEIKPRTNCAGVDLSGRDLANASLSDADLSGANLAGANLTGVDFYSTNLSGAVLADAQLIGAVLNRTDLSNANLSRADLTAADIRAADLSSADLSNAKLGRAELTYSDLSGATWIDGQICAPGSIGACKP